MNNMLFWIIILVLTASVIAVIALAMYRGPAESDAQDYDLRVYRDQLAEVDRDLARGVIPETDAERVRTEISRRILAADAAQQSGTAQRHATGGGYIATGVIAAILVGGSVTLYSQLGAPGYGDLGLKDRIAASETFRATRPSQGEVEASLTPEDLPPVPEVDDNYQNLVEQLRGVTSARPDDAEGFRLLTVSEANLGNFPAAHAAQARLIDIAGDAATSEDHTRLANLMILAAGGYVSPQAEAALENALELSPQDGTALYYWGLMLEQTGRPDQSLRIWDGLLRQGPPEAPWIQPIQVQIERIAARAGVAYAIPAPGTGRGPSQADISAAGEISASERLEMIEGMVNGLSERLATEGGTVNEWAQLITSLGVLGRFSQAEVVYQEAAALFGQDPGAMDRLNRAGEQAGIIE